jgi:predicted N-acetyltransferase YhbS
VKETDRVLIGDLADYRQCLPTLARWHFDQWGALTGARTFEDYVALLSAAADSRTVPSVLVALADGELLGSANLVAADLPPRAHLTPWFGQLFVAPTRRRTGVGAALVQAVLDRARRCGYARVHLYTSGTLPQYYRRLGWRATEQLIYLGHQRTVMEYDLERGAEPSRSRG